MKKKLLLLLLIILGYLTYQYIFPLLNVVQDKSVNNLSLVDELQSQGEKYVKKDVQSNDEIRKMLINDLTQITVDEIQESEIDSSEYARYNLSEHEIHWYHIVIPSWKVSFDRPFGGFEKEDNYVYQDGRVLGLFKEKDDVSLEQYLLSHIGEEYLDDCEVRIKEDGNYFYVSNEQDTYCPFSDMINFYHWYWYDLGETWLLVGDGVGRNGLLFPYRLTLGEGSVERESFTESQSGENGIYVGNNQKSIFEDNVRLLSIDNETIFDYFYDETDLCDRSNVERVEERALFCNDIEHFKSKSRFSEIDIAPDSETIVFAVESEILSPDRVLGVYRKDTSTVKMLTSFYLDNTFLAFSPNGLNFGIEFVQRISDNEFEYMLGSERVVENF